MKIAEINMVDYGSTGKIMLQIAQCARTKGHEARTFSKKWKKQIPPDDSHFYYGTTLENGIHVLLFRLIGFQGLFSYFGTKQLVRALEMYQPDVIHLHNLHDSSTCIPVLFDYIRKHNLQTVWTLHDCWSFTGQCPHFTLAGCEKWQSGCHDCPQQSAWLPVDCSRWMWKKKRQWFTGLSNMTLVTPSQWLADLVQQSFLKDYPVRVIHNGIDLSVFHPTQSSFREIHGIADSQFVVLGVAFNWEKRKGLDVFLELAKRLPLSYKIVLVGTDDQIDRLLPDRILSIHRTKSQQELAQLYSAADVFVNPTREDNFPTTNIEALACGTPVVTFRTGGSPEIPDASCGSVVDCDDVDALEKQILHIRQAHPFSQEACLRRAQLFDREARFREYVRLFETSSKQDGDL